MNGINRFGEEHVGGGNGHNEFSTFGDGDTRTRHQREQDEEISFFLQFTDRQLAVACADDDEKNSKINSIVNQHFQGRTLSDKQRWCLAKHCVDFGKKVEK